MPEQQTGVSSRHVLLNRPDGALLFGLSGASFAIAIIVLLTAFVVPTRNYAGDPDLTGIVWRWWLLVASGFSFQIAVLFLPAAFIVRALWLLPGELTKVRSVDVRP